ncbi:hypothetical protein KJ652_00595 [Patescibacteria group bacterium]|nr:hypothetical protein [Patescibacteria group bacterium]MBU1123070.1 hypothetical protein [Patescibacteria group bacterium]
MSTAEKRPPAEEFAKPKLKEANRTVHVLGGDLLELDMDIMSRMRPNERNQWASRVKQLITR